MLASHAEKVSHPTLVGIRRLGFQISIVAALIPISVIRCVQVIGNLVVASREKPVTDKEIITHDILGWSTPGIPPRIEPGLCVLDSTWLSWRR